MVPPPPGRATRAALLAGLAAAAALALFVTHRHFAREDAQVAITRVQTWRVAGTTRSRVDAWLSRERPDAPLAWRADPPGWFEDHVRVRLEVAGEIHEFRVQPDERQVEPVGEAARRLVEAIREDARRAEP
ncbi:MAG: hypothetical protein R3F60_09845 [bacterium]